MELEEAGQAEGESASYGKTAPGQRLLPIGAIVPVALLAAVVVFFGLGFRFGFTQGDSMEPNYHDGSLIIEREVDPTSLKVGDVISFYAPWADSRVMHRIVSIGTRNGQLQFHTRGDNNPVRDPGAVSFRGENPRKIMLAVPGGLEAAIAIALVVLGVFAVKAVGGLVSEDG